VSVLQQTQSSNAYKKLQSLTQEIPKMWGTESRKTPHRRKWKICVNIQKLYYWNTSRKTFNQNKAAGELVC
jgi:hypothetical protein